MDAFLPYLTVFGTTKVARCQARSKRSGQQCSKASMKGKTVCRTHGGASTGPRSAVGRQRCAAAKTIHGRETRIKRQARTVKLRELRELEAFMKDARMIL